MVNAIAMVGVAASLIVSSMLSATPLEDDVAAPDGVAAEIVTVNGSGCPNATGTVFLSADRTTLRLSAPAYVALAGGVAGPTDFRENCQIAVNVTVPKGYTYGVSRVTSTGFAHLASGATGTGRVSLYFQGQSETTQSSRTFNGQFSDYWEVTTSFGASSINYAPCGEERYLNVNTEVRVSVGSSDPEVTSFMVRDPNTLLKLAWKRC